MKGLLVLTLAILVAATALAYGGSDMAAAVTATDWPGEPTALLLSGGALIGLAGAVRRYTL